LVVLVPRAIASICETARDRVAFWLGHLKFKRADFDLRERDGPDDLIGRDETGVSRHCFSMGESHSIDSKRGRPSFDVGGERLDHSLGHRRKCCHYAPYKESDLEPSRGRRFQPSAAPFTQQIPTNCSRPISLDGAR
jgi:hypothetical protein